MDLPAADSSPALADLPVLSESLVVASQPYVGQWNRLVSTTNWEKGRIIVQWREALISQGLPVAEYSDEAWCRLVGGVTGQHVGRLRRVFQRFGEVQKQFKGLYWSHFQAAIDWNDAEMWLEGAVQSLWSVSQMRHQRWETLGGTPDSAPREEDAVAGELDEDFEPAQNREPESRSVTGTMAEVSGPAPEGPDFGEETVEEFDVGLRRQNVARSIEQRCAEAEGRLADRQ